MMTLDEIRAALADRNARRVAERTGLGYNTVIRVRSGLNGDYSYRVLKTLSDYLSGQGAEHDQDAA